jgi:hypothetical protein
VPKTVYVIVRALSRFKMMTTANTKRDAIRYGAAVGRPHQFVITNSVPRTVKEIQLMHHVTVCLLNFVF